MSKHISTLNVGLTGTVTGFTKPFGTARQSVKGLSSELGSLKGKLGAAIGAGLAAVGIYSATSFVKGQMDSIDATSKLADRLGTTTEALTGLQYSGDLAGVSAEAVAGGLEKMLKTIAGVKEEGDDATDALSKLGLSAAQLKKIPADAAFGQIADKINAIENPTDRAAAAMGVFGKSGQALLPLLKEGSAGLRLQMEEAKRLGITFSRLDAAKVEAANDAMTRASQVAVGVGRSLAIALSPHIDDAAVKTQEYALSAIAAVNSGIEWARNNQDTAASIAAVVGGATAAVVVLPRLASTLSAVASGAKLAGTAVKLALANPIMTVGVGAFVALAAVAIRSKTANESWEDSAYHVVRGIGAIGDATLDLGDAYEAAGKAQEKVLSATNAVSNAKTPQDEIAANQRLATALQRRVDLMEKVNEANAAGDSKTPELSFSQKLVADTQKKLSDLREKIAAMQDKEIKFKPTLDPDNLSLSIKPEIDRPKAIKAGSAEAQLARYLNPKVKGPAARATPGAAKPTPTTKPAAATPAPVKTPPPTTKPATPTTKPTSPEPKPAAVRPPQVATVSKYNSQGRAEITDAKRTESGQFSVKSKVTGIRAVLDADQKQNVTDELSAQQAANRKRLTQPYSAARRELSDAQAAGEDRFRVRSRSGISAVLTQDQRESLRQSITTPNVNRPAPVKDAAKDATETGKKQVSELTRQTPILESIDRKIVPLQIASF